MSATRPTKKQRELLSFIEAFITGHGYGPSYREIMRALGYKSVSTVAAHIDNLISRGHLNKRTNSARSLEVVHQRNETVAPQRLDETSCHEEWLLELIEKKFSLLEEKPNVRTTHNMDELYVLVGALHILGFEAIASQFKNRLQMLITPAQQTQE